ncbi:MAG: DNA polymerase I [Firmicutes bacterium]|nr:DNA polymerase I [Bacillota bacterium]
MKKSVMLIDANSLLYRAFFALPPLENSKGQPTGAVYGFINMLMKLLEEYPVDYAVAAFDLPGPTRRAQEYQEYKANRPPTPDDLRSQMEIARDVLRAMGINLVELEGYEADDLVGTLARMAKANGCFAWIVSGDRDILQVVDDNTKVILTHTYRGASQTTVYDAAAVAERYQVTPPKLVDIKGLAGDSSDNIPGVPGIGEKTAIKLIAQFGSVEGVYENLGALRGKIRENLETHREQAFLSRKLAEIDTAAPLPLQWPPAPLVRDDQQLYKLFKELEFNSLLQRLELAESPAARPATVTRPSSTALFARSELAVLLLDGAVAAGTEEESALFDGDSFAAAREGLLQALGREDCTIITDDAKAVFRLALDAETGVKARVHSCQLAAYLLRPGSSMEIPALVRAWTGAVLDQGDLSRTEYIAAHVALLPGLWRELQARLREADAWRLYSDIELPLSKVLARMERTGIAVDVGELDAMGRELDEKIAQLQQRIYAAVGYEFNINSPKQLGEVLFERLNIPPVRKTKTGYSTDAAVLETIMDRHQAVPMILEYRQLMKLKTTYIDGLKGVWQEETGRIYTTFNQMVTATGRLSSTEPNLQNIPIRMEEGRRIRKAFVPGGGYQWLLAADYSQIELRVLAHIARDETLMEAFREGQDIHRRTAAEIFGVSLDQVTPAQRRAAKAVNFGLVYGQTDFGLARSLGISRAEAAGYIEAYFKRYPGVKEYMERVVAEARQRGYVTTLFNRRRYLPEINSRNFQRRSFAERTAINTPIQGSAADIIKLAMVEVEKRLEAEGLVTRMLLQIHDELVLETTTEEKKRVARLVRQAMEEVVQLDVPLVVDVKAGPDLFTMEPLKE